MMEEEDKIVQKTSRIRLIKDKMAGSMMLTFTLVSVLLVVLIGIGLVLKSLPILHDKSLWELLSGAKWKPGISVSCRLLWVPFG
jgi:phosphate transport system permease protein